MSERNLTDADLKALAELLHHSCTFDEESRVHLRALSRADPNILVRLAESYQDATGYLWKGILGAVFIGALGLAAFGMVLSGKFPFLAK